MLSVSGDRSVVCGEIFAAEIKTLVKSGSAIVRAAHDAA